jgi:hypothetical protein
MKYLKNGKAAEYVSALIVLPFILALCDADENIVLLFVYLGSILGIAHSRIIGSGDDVDTIHETVKKSSPYTKKFLERKT